MSPERGPSPDTTTVRAYNSVDNSCSVLVALSTCSSPHFGILHWEVSFPSVQLKLSNQQSSAIFGSCQNQVDDPAYGILRMSAKW